MFPSVTHLVGNTIVLQSSTNNFSCSLVTHQSKRCNFPPVGNVCLEHSIKGRIFQEFLRVSRPMTITWRRSNSPSEFQLRIMKINYLFEGYICSKKLVKIVDSIHKWVQIKHNSQPKVQLDKIQKVWNSAWNFQKVYLLREVSTNWKIRSTNKDKLNITWSALSKTIC